MRRVVQQLDERETVNIKAEVKSAIEAVEAESVEGEIVLTGDTEPAVTAHPELETAIRHLIRNGLEHNTSEHPRVTVTMSETAAGPTVEIVDNGPGIETHELGILNEHGESALKHGTGTGLWIVDRVIDYSEALLEFDTGDGTKVTITFKRAETT